MFLYHVFSRELPCQWQLTRKDEIKKCRHDKKEHLFFTYVEKKEAKATTLAFVLQDGHFVRQTPIGR